MESILKANEAALAKRYPQLHMQWKSLSWQEQEPAIEVRVEISKSQLPTLCVKTNEQEGFLYSRYQPVVEAGRWAEQLYDPMTEAIVLVGLGLGYPLQALRQAFGPEVPILAYEPSFEIFEQAMQAADLASAFLDENTEVVVGDEELFIQRIKALMKTNKFNVKWFEWPAYHRLFLEQGAPLRDEFLRLGKEVEIAHNTYIRFHRLWPENCLKNLVPTLKSPGIKELAGKFEGRPAIVVCAGPSLKNQIELLRQVKGKAVIICVDTAYRVLVQHDIEPDLICAIDGTLDNYKHFRGLTSRGVPLLFMPMVHHKIVEEFGQKTIVSSVVDSMGELVEGIVDKGGVIIGGSVSTLGLQAARVMGADPIVFIGQDLGFTNGQTYSQGVFDPDTPKEKGRHLPEFPVESNDGGTVLTNDSFNVIRKWLGDLMNAIGSSTRVINATGGGGAKIEGTEIMSFAEVVERYCQEPFDVQSVFEELGEDDPALMVAVAERLRTHLRYMHQLNRLARFASHQVVRLTDLLLDAKANQREINSILAYLERIDAHFSSHRTMQWLGLLMLAKYTDISLDHHELKARRLNDYMEATRIVQNYAYLYQGYTETTTELRGMMDEAYQALKKEIAPSE